MTRRVRWGEFATEFEKGRRRGSRNSNRGWGACRRPHSRQERGPPLKSKAYAIDIASVCSGLRLHHSCIASSCIYFVPIASDHAIEPAVVDLVRSYPRRSTKLYISLALSLVLSLALSHALSLALSRSLSLARSLSRARARARTFSRSLLLTFSLSFSLARALSRSLFLTFSLSLWFSLSPS